MSNDALDQRVAVVTGAAQGIGEATARALARQGARVAVVDVDERGSQVAASLRGCAFFGCDVSDAAAVARTFQQVRQTLGPAEILVNNAGIQRYGTVVSTPEQEWDRVMAVNLKSAYLCAKFAVPQMLERGSGVVINVASVQAFQCQPEVAAYATSKAALLGLTRSIAVDFAPAVRCVAVCPGAVDTPMLREAAASRPVPPGTTPPQSPARIAKPEEIADLIVYLAGDKAAFITGEAIRVDGGLGLALPGERAEQT